MRSRTDAASTSAARTPYHREYCAVFGMSPPDGPPNSTLKNWLMNTMRTDAAPCTTASWLRRSIRCQRTAEPSSPNPKTTWAARYHPQRRDEKAANRASGSRRRKTSASAATDPTGASQRACRRHRLD